MPDSSFSVVNPVSSYYNIVMDATNSSITPYIRFGTASGSSSLSHSFYVSSNNTVYIDNSSDISVGSLNADSIITASLYTSNIGGVQYINASAMSLSSYVNIGTSSELRTSIDGITGYASFPNINTDTLFVKSSLYLNQWSGSNPENALVGIKGIVVDPGSSIATGTYNSMPSTDSALPTCNAVRRYMDGAVENLYSRYALLSGENLVDNPESSDPVYNINVSSWVDALGVAYINAANISGDSISSWQSTLDVFTNSYYNTVVEPEIQAKASISYVDILNSSIQSVISSLNSYAKLSGDNLSSIDFNDSAWRSALNVYSTSELYTIDQVDNNFAKNDGTNLTSPENWRNKLQVYSKDETKNLIMQMQCVVYDTVNNAFMVWNDEAQKWVTIGIKGSIADEYYPVYSDAPIQPPSPNS